MLCLFLCCCISPLVLSKPISLQWPAPSKEHGYGSFLLLPHWQAVQMEESEYLTFLPNRNNINSKKTMSSFPIPRAVLPAGNGAEWINVLLKLMHDDKGVAVLNCWTRRMQSERNSSFTVYSSHSEQTLLCLRQLHFYDHDQAFFSAFFILMSAVLKKLSQWGTPYREFPLAHMPFF